MESDDLRELLISLEKELDPLGVTRVVFTVNDDTLNRDLPVVILDDEERGFLPIFRPQELYGEVLD